MLRDQSIKLVFSTEELRLITEAAAAAGYSGRGAVSRYLRALLGLDEIAPGAKLGNQNKTGKTKDDPNRN